MLHKESNFVLVITPSSASSTVPDIQYVVNKYMYRFNNEDGSNVKIF